MNEAQAFEFRVVGSPDPLKLWFRPNTKLQEVQETIERCQLIPPRNSFHFIHESEYLPPDKQLNQIGLAPNEMLIIQSGSKRSLQTEQYTQEIAELARDNFDAPTAIWALDRAYGNVDYALQILNGTQPPETDHSRWRKRLIADPNAFQAVLSEYTQKNRGQPEENARKLCAELALNPSAYIQTVPPPRPSPQTQTQTQTQGSKPRLNFYDRAKEIPGSEILPLREIIAQCNGDEDMAIAQVKEMMGIPNE
jgi:hypothetical protein